jgi:ABC-2 type transport system ATP-binding protein
MIRELSAEELDATRKKSVRMEVTDTAVLARVLDGLLIKYRIVSESVADVYAHINVTQLVLALAEEGCEVLSMQERNEGLQSYYLSLVGGGET